MKIGFIDKWLDEWHANNMPAWLRERIDVEAIFAYEMMPFPNGIPGKEWAQKHDAVLCDSIEEVVKNSDVLIVFAPSFPELHEELCDAPLKSGKPTYVDKTFAPDVESAKRLIEKANKYNTPLFTTSALRYSNELPALDKANIETLSIRGAGPLEMYSIHYIEQMVCLLGTEPESVMFTGTIDSPAYVVRFSNNRWAMAQHLGWDFPFNLAIKYSDEKPSVQVDECTDFFPGFVTKLVEFFETGINPVDYNETLAVIAIRAMLLKAKDKPGTWVDITTLK